MPNAIGHRLGNTVPVRNRRPYRIFSHCIYSPHLFFIARRARIAAQPNAVPLYLASHRREAALCLRPTPPPQAHMLSGVHIAVSTTVLSSHCTSVYHSGDDVKILGARKKHKQRQQQRRLSPPFIVPAPAIGLEARTSGIRARARKSSAKTTGRSVRARNYTQEESARPTFELPIALLHARFRA